MNTRMQVITQLAITLLVAPLTSGAQRYELLLPDGQRKIVTDFNFIWISHSGPNIWGKSFSAERETRNFVVFKDGTTLKMNLDETDTIEWGSDGSVTVRMPSGDLETFPRLRVPTFHTDQYADIESFRGKVTLLGKESTYTTRKLRSVTVLRATTRTDVQTSNSTTGRLPSIRAGENFANLKLPIGVKGVIYENGINGLPAGVVIESIFHRLVDSPERFSVEWKRHEDGAQILVGYWQKNQQGKWERQMKMVAIPENYRPQSARVDYQQSVAELPEPSTRAIQTLQQARSAYQRQVTTIATQSANSQPTEVTEALSSARRTFDQVLSSPEIAEAKAKVLESFTQNAPLAQKIILRTVEKTVADRDTILINLAASTVTGGGTVAPIVIDNAIVAGFEVLSEEGILTEDQANVLRGASAVLQAMNGITTAEDVTSSLSAVRDAYDGLVEIGVIDEDQMDDKVKAQIKSGAQVLDFIIQLKGDE